MNEILDLIQQNGDLFYFITFIWTALEGETFVVFAGLAAQRGLLNVYILFVAAALGSMLGDQFFFFIGRFFGRRIVQKKPSLKPKLQKVFDALEKYDVVFILSYRFMYGVRNISALAIGMSQISWRRFFLLNTLASFLWSFIFCGGGYLFGEILNYMGIANDENVDFDVRNLMIAVLVLFVSIVGLRFWMAKRNKAALEEKTEDKE
ncbi:MAG TPA: DedA family protein [Rhodospirillaceae bacterium]|nr:DedA family protein [Rhodospirillaceae bacterium]